MGPLLGYIKNSQQNRKKKNFGVSHEFILHTD